jgi:hypothetical protein
VTAKRKAYLLALAVWPLFLVTAVMLGAVRERVIAPALGEHTAHVIGTLLFIAVMLAIMWGFVGKVSGTVQRLDLWLIGVMWTVMTVCFEFGFFHFVAGVPWEKLLAGYNLFAGRLWVLVLLTTLCGPALTGWWHNSGRRDDQSA